jgi:hypothetical protein
MYATEHTSPARRRSGAGRLRRVSRVLAWLWLVAILGGLALLGAVALALPTVLFAAPESLAWLVITAAALLTLSVPGVLVLDLLGRSQEDLDPPRALRCRACGYSLVGKDHLVCPECGTPPDG